MNRRLVVALLVGALAVAGFAVVSPFVVSMLWAAILVHSSWPMYGWVYRVCGARATLASAIMVLMLALAFVVPLFVLIAALHVELIASYHAALSFLHNLPTELPQSVRALPIVGEWLQAALARAHSDPGGLAAQIADWAAVRGTEITHLVGGAGRNTAKFAIALFAAFFFYRDGEHMLGEVRRALHRAIGSRVDHYLAAIARTTRAVLYGHVLTALAQGTLAAIGYAVAGLAAPMLLGALTALLALLPFGAVLMWGGASVALLVAGHASAGIGLALWGMVGVSWVDNLLRPLVISSAADIPFLLVVFGALGGLTAFGLVGVFLGPVLLAVLHAVWREWLEAGAQ